MNPAARILRSHLRHLQKDFRLVYRRTEESLNRGRWRYLGFLIVTLLVSWLFVHPYDRPIIDNMVANQDPSLDHLAKTLGHWGDFAQFNLLGFALLWIFGAVTRLRWFQRLAVVTFYSALFAGLNCNLFRFTQGRPRPYANVEDKFYGLPGVFRGWDYHGFPSGHTSTAMGMGTPVFAAGGVYGLPVFAFGASVGWARLYRQKHYPTDVIVGGALGVIYGIATGWHLRRIRIRLLRQGRSRRRRRRAAAKDTADAG